MIDTVNARVVCDTTMPQLNTLSYYFVLESMDEDDDVPTLSAETFAALQEFYSEQQKRQEIFTKLQENDKLKENVLFDENWVRIFCLKNMVERDPAFIK